ncbi:hypothetical protein D3C86_1835590 [compost metagenome]
MAKALGVLQPLSDGLEMPMPLGGCWCLRLFMATLISFMIEGGAIPTTARS